MFQKQFIKIVSVITLLFSSTAFAVDKAATSSTTSDQFEVTKTTKMAQIRALPDNKLVHMKNGQVIPAKNLKAFADMLKSVKTKGGVPRATEKFSSSQGAAQIQLTKGSNLHFLQSRNNSEVIQLPSGRKLTVSDFKKLDQIAVAITGKSLTSRQAAPPKGSGTPIKIKSKQDFATFGDKPDSAILESPSGKKITLGELRAYAKKNNKPLGVR